MPEAAPDLFSFTPTISTNRKQSETGWRTHSEHGPPVGGRAGFCVDSAAWSLSTDSLPVWEAKRNISRENVAPVKAEAAVPPVITSERIHLHLRPFSLGLRAAQIVSHINVQKKSPEPPSRDLSLTFVMCEVCKRCVCVCVCREQKGGKIYAHRLKVWNTEHRLKGRKFLQS